MSPFFSQISDPTLTKKDMTTEFKYVYYNLSDVNTIKKTRDLLDSDEKIKEKERISGFLKRISMEYDSPNSMSPDDVVMISRLFRIMAKQLKSESKDITPDVEVLCNIFSILPSFTIKFGRDDPSLVRGSHTTAILALLEMEKEKDNAIPSVMCNRERLLSLIGLHYFLVKNWYLLLASFNPNRLYLEEAVDALFRSTNVLPIIKTMCQKMETIVTKEYDIIYAMLKILSDTDYNKLELTVYAYDIVMKHVYMPTLTMK